MQDNSAIGEYKKLGLAKGIGFLFIAGVMSNLSHSDSRRRYSWWWDSHNAPKNSKWLQENLTDIDGKVKSMIKLIEEDADSFARRAEMYYKKRPELMKLVEEFYRAYRALAERYNHATGELRHAQQTIAKVFPDEVNFESVDDDSPSEVSPHTPEMKPPLRALFDVDGLSSSECGSGKRGLKLLPEMLGSEVECLKKALSDMKAEKDNALIQYQQCLEKLSEAETKLYSAQKDLAGHFDKAGLAEIEVQTLKESLIQFEVEKIAEMIKQNFYLEKISCLEALVSQLQEDMKGLDGRASEAESRTRKLKDEILKLELERETAVCQYMQSLGKISDLEKIISSNEDEAKFLKKQAEIAESEVFELKLDFSVLNKEKEDAALEYKWCLEKISELEKELSIAKKEVDRLNNEVLTGKEKLENAYEKCALMEKSNYSLRNKADNLSKRIVIKDQELVEKQEELERFQKCLLDENSRRERVEEALESLQNLESQSRDDRRALELEIDNVIRLLKEMEISKNGLEEEIRLLKDENHSNENMQSEIVFLREIKDKHEEEVVRHAGLADSLQKEISCLNEEIKGLNKSYRGLVEQVEAAGLSPQCVEISIKSLHDENLKLMQKYEEENIEKTIISRKLEEMEEAVKKNAISESDLNAELLVSRGEKASILSQLHVVTENMRNLLGKNTVLENSLTTAKVELQGLREKSKGLEDICELLKNERSYLLTERCALVSKLEFVEKRLNSLEKQFTGLEEKCAGIEKEREAMRSQVENLSVSLCEEEQERKCSKLESETRLAGLENRIFLLQEENKWKRKESEEELDKSLKAQFEISILHKFIMDMEEKNCSLIIECQKHVEASRLAEKVISELESESLEQQVEAELLMDEIERLRLGIYRIFRALECGSDCDIEESSLSLILGSIEDLKCRVVENEDENQQLFVENSVLSALLEEMESKGMDIESKKLEVMAEKMVSVEKEKDELFESNEKLKLDANKGRLEAEFLEAELDGLCVKQVDLRKAYDALQESYSRANEDNACLLKNISELKEEKSGADRENDSLLFELLATENQSAVLKSFGAEKVSEIDALSENLDLQKAESSLLKAKLKAAEKLNSDLLGSLSGQRIELSKARENLEREIECLSMVNKNLESELITLRLEMEENTSREHSLSTELQEMSNEFEMWEAEASSFCFDLHVSSVHEVLLKNKVQELSEVCKGKESEIEEMKEKMLSMENEVSSLRSQVRTYEPVIASLRDDIETLEGNARVTEVIETSGITLPEDQSLLTLRSLQLRVKAVGKLIQEANKPVSRRRSKSGSTLEFSRKGYYRNRTIMKDIPLDQVSNNSSMKKGKAGSDDITLELCESTDEENKASYKFTDLPPTDSDVERELAVDKQKLSSRNFDEPNDVKILERLASDAEKLESLQTTLRNLRRRSEADVKGKDVNFDVVREQLQEAEDAVIHLVDLNGQLEKNILECPKDEMEETVRTWRFKVMEKAEKGSERIEWLQLGLERTQYLLLKMENEKAKRNKGKKGKFFGSKAVVLSELVRNGRRKKGPRCGCFRQPTTANGNGY